MYDIVLTLKNEKRQHRDFKIIHQTFLLLFYLHFRNISPFSETVKLQCIPAINQLIPS